MNPQSKPSTPSYTINCRMTHEPAALERLCQVVRIRGFRVLAISAEQAEGIWTLTMTVAGVRPLEMLISQLEKLTSVTEVSRSDCAATTRKSA